MIPDEDLVLHRGTRNPLLPFDHWLRAFDGHTSRRDGLETSFVAMIPLYRRVIETQDICMLTRDRFDDKRTRRRTEYHCYSFYSTKACTFLHDIFWNVFFKKFVLLFFFKRNNRTSFLWTSYESVREQAYLHMWNCSYETISQNVFFNNKLDIENNFSNAIVYDC